MNKVGFMSRQIDQKVLCDEMYPSRINYHDVSQYKKVLASQNMLTEQARKKVKEQRKQQEFLDKLKLNPEYKPLAQNKE